MLNLLQSCNCSFYIYIVCTMIFSRHRAKRKYIEIYCSKKPFCNFSPSQGFVKMNQQKTKRIKMDIMFEITHEMRSLPKFIKKEDSLSIWLKTDASLKYLQAKIVRNLCGSCNFLNSY